MSLLRVDALGQARGSIAYPASTWLLFIDVVKAWKASEFVMDRNGSSDEEAKPYH